MKTQTLLIIAALWFQGCGESQTTREAVELADGTYDTGCISQGTESYLFQYEKKGKETVVVQKAHRDLTCKVDAYVTITEKRHEEIVGYNESLGLFEIDLTLISSVAIFHHELTAKTYDVDPFVEVDMSGHKSGSQTFPEKGEVIKVSGKKTLDGYHIETWEHRQEGFDKSKRSLDVTSFVFTKK